MMSDSTTDNKNNTFPEFDDFADASYAAWKAAAVAALKGASFEKSLFSQVDNELEIKPLYVKDDILNSFHTQKDVFGDSYPVLRNPDIVFADSNSPHSSEENPQTDIAGWKLDDSLRAGWRVGQRYQICDRERFVKLLEDDLDAGLEEIHIPFDFEQFAKVKRGIDINSDAFFAVGAGFKIDTVDDLVPLFKNLRDLKKVPEYPVFIDFKASFVAGFSFLEVLCQKSGVSIENLTGFAGGSPVATLALTGKLPSDSSKIFDDLAETVKRASLKAPHLKSVMVDSSPWSYGGASAVSEVALTLLELVSYLNEFTQRGVDLDKAAGALCVTLAVGNNFFVEIAKIRALKLLFKTVAIKMGVSLKDTDLFVYSKGAVSVQSNSSPHVNVLRSITQTLSGAMGGADSIHAVAFDEFAVETGEFSSRIARNIQLVARDEFFIGHVKDPLKGGFFVESLTAQIIEKAYALFGELNAKGNIIDLFVSGHINRLLKKQQDVTVKDIKKRKRKLVGVNDYVYFNKTPLEVDSGSENRLDRDFLQDRSITSDRDVSYNKIKTIDDAVLAFLNGESFDFINNALFDGSDAFIKCDPVNLVRLPVVFERLQNRVRVLNSIPEVLILEIGKAAKLKFRTAFVKSYLSSAGFEPVVKQLANADDDVDYLDNKNIKLVVVSSSDELYIDTVEKLSNTLSDRLPDALRAIAGRPGDQEDKFKRSGFDIFIYLGSDVVDTVDKILDRLEGHRIGSGKMESGR